MSLVRILGIDPGLRLTGFGVIEIDSQKSNSKITYVTSGVIKTASAKKNVIEGEDDREELPARLKVILDGLFEVIDTYKPNQVAIEKVFVNVNPQSTLLLGQARGAAISAAVIRNLSVAEYTALQVKQSVVGNGHAQKEQVQEMVKRLLNLPAAPKSDSADALACAICHAHGGQGLGKLATAGFRVKNGRLI
ncbi:MAG: crossover junction endodeoxyribonuclease RuvC [Bdellovibrio sp.]|nr:crossover junction endodeoxyribonuclease RuvC [Methylotenera sp.]